MRDIIMTDLEKLDYLVTAQNHIYELSEHLRKLINRNKDINHKNRKIYHLLCNPITFINVYEKISKNKGVFTKSYNNEETIEFFGQTTAEGIAKSFKKETYEFLPVR